MSPKIDFDECYYAQLNLSPVCKDCKIVLEFQKDLSPAHDAKWSVINFKCPRCGAGYAMEITLHPWG
jgi:predicted RNA-binding Zn-ribbon protein involved in translation (DUF1610 family)